MMTSFLRTAAVGFASVLFAFNSPAQTQPGVALTFTPVNGDASQSDTVIRSNVWLHVAKGETPSPFLAPGPFTAQWHGFLSVELRSIYTFQAEVNGSLQVVINAREILNVTGDGKMSEPGVRVRLNKGTNDVLVTYTPAATGDPHVRLFWTARDSYAQLIPDTAWSYVADDATTHSLRRHQGRALVIEYRCARCHKVEGQGIPELMMNAPVFDGIASRRNPAWIRQWLTNPTAERANTRMPEIFHGGEAIDATEEVAAFLATLGDPGWSAAPEPNDAASVAAGEKLFGELHCVACHNPPGTAKPDADKISFNHVAQKFKPGALARFLGEPTEHYGAIRMPDFRLSNAEAGHIAAFLLAKADPVNGVAPRPELAAKGRDLVQTVGCLSCHNLQSVALENQLKPKAMAELANWETGCLAATPQAGTHTPFFNFSDADRLAIREFAKVGFGSLTRNVDADFAARQTANLNCIGCHNRQIDLVPQFGILGGKIRPEYGAEIIAGQVANKPRPWITARMPGFATRAEGIARGIANLHGFPAVTPPEPSPIDEDLAQAGFRLVQPDGGFSCISCHAIGMAPATQVFESAGIDFAWTTTRLQHDYFVRWLRNPLSVDPTTKMPVFFDESGHSPIDLLGGDTLKQIDALWQYLRHGDQMKVPPGMTVGGTKPVAPQKFE